MAEVLYRDSVNFAHHGTIGVVVSFGDTRREERRSDDYKLFIVECRFVEASCDEGAWTAPEGRWLLITETFQIILRCRGKDEWTEDKKTRILVHQIWNH